MLHQTLAGFSECQMSSSLSILTSSRLVVVVMPAYPHPEFFSVVEKQRGNRDENSILKKKKIIST